MWRPLLHKSNVEQAEACSGRSMCCYSFLLFVIGHSFLIMLLVIHFCDMLFVICYLFYVFVVIGQNIYISLNIFILLPQLPNHKPRKYSSNHILKVYKAPNQSVVRSNMFL